MKQAFLLVVAVIAFVPYSPYAQVQAQPKAPVVVELFTSQGCPGCPRADALLKKIAGNPHFLPLSYHVTYFDSRGWKDPFASTANVDRQKAYVRWFGLDTIFTPHMVIDGEQSLVGSDAKAVAQGLEKARAREDHIPIVVELNQTGEGLDVNVGDGSAPVPQDTLLYEVHFNRMAVTPIRAGDNGGMTVENVNNVVAFFPIALLSHYYVPINSFSEDGIAYLLQASNGKILGAAYYMRK